MTDKQKALLEMWFEACREYFDIFLKYGDSVDSRRRCPNLIKYWRLGDESRVLLDKMLDDLQEATGDELENWEDIERAYRKMTQNQKG